MAWLIPLIFVVIGPYAVSDLAVWIAQGQYFLQHHQLLRNDIFSVLPTTPMVYPSWGISIVYALIYAGAERVLGFTASASLLSRFERTHTSLVIVCLFHSLVLMYLLWIIYRASILKLVNPANPTARILTYTFWLGAYAAFGERPSMIALVPLVLAFLEIAKIEKLSDIKMRTIVHLSLINLVWVNIHGSFILLWLMLIWKSIGLFIATPRTEKRPGAWQNLAIAHLSIFLSTLVNPFGIAVFPFILETMRRSQGRMISEWAPTTPWAHLPTSALYFGLLVGAGIFLRRRWGHPDFWLLTSNPFFLLLLNGLTAVRNSALPFVVLLPALQMAGLLERGDSVGVPPDHSLDPPRPRNIYKLALFIFILISMLPNVKTKFAFLLPPHRREVFDDSAPFHLAEYISRSGKTCPIFNGWDVGSFLLFTLPNRIYFDARNIIYSDEQFLAYLKASQARPGWQAYLNQYGTCFAVLERGFDGPLILAMHSTSEWRFVTEDQDDLLFEKADFESVPL
jgi:hypothetical protein